jgi:hypothetical protein
MTAESFDAAGREKAPTAPNAAWSAAVPPQTSLKPTTF